MNSRRNIEIRKKMLASILVIVVAFGGLPVFVKTASATAGFSVSDNTTLPEMTSGRSTSIVFGDFNSDEYMDALYQNDATPGQAISLVLGVGDGSFDSPINADNTGTFTSGPFNGITFSRVNTTGTIGTRLDVVDIDGDGDDDLVETTDGGNSRLLINNAGLFSIVSSTGLPNVVTNSLSCFVFGDFNLDGLVDILYQNQAATSSLPDKIAFVPGIGNGNFGTVIHAKSTGEFESGPFAGITFRRVYKAGAEYTDLKVVDIDNDGDVDLVETNTGVREGPSAPTRVFLNQAGVFTIASSTSLPDLAFRAAGGMIFGDFDSDGYKDVLYQNQSGRVNDPMEIALMHGTGNGDFGAVIQADSTGTFSSGPLTGIQLKRVFYMNGSMVNLRVVDIDNDGDDDLVEMNSAAAARVILQSDGPPSISSFSPVNQATNVAASTDISIVFDKVIASAGSGSIQIRRASDQSVVETVYASSEQVSGLGSSTLTIQPLHDLEDRTEYYITIGKHAFYDSNGRMFMGLVKPIQWRFTTGPLLPPAAPSVTVNDTANTIVGLDTTMEFQVDGGIYVKYNGTNAPELSGIRTVKVRVAAQDSVPAGEETTLSFTSNPVQSNDDSTDPITQISTSTSTPTPTPTPTITPDTVEVLINGKAEQLGAARTTEDNGVKTLTILLDSQVLLAKLNAEASNAIVKIPVKSTASVIVGELDGQMVRNMEDKHATLELWTDKASYTLPAEQINISALSEQFGSDVKLEEIKVRIEIAEVSSPLAQLVAVAASGERFAVVAPPLSFTIKGVFNGKTVEVSRFNAYIERTILLPEGIDPSKITTGIVVELDGTVRHVPTKVILMDGRYYARINSLTNSLYSVIWHPITFSDVDQHWAKDTVNDMGSRFVFSGVDDNTFNPDAAITRAEFTEILVRGLGLGRVEESHRFTDVAAEAWYASTVQIAHSYGLINGFEDGSFRPNTKITREQAMVIVAKAMKLTGLAEKTGSTDPGATLGVFVDGERTSGWAQSSVALAVKAGLISGRSGGRLEAKENVSRAEVAVLVWRLLQKSDLI